MSGADTDTDLTIEAAVGAVTTLCVQEDQVKTYISQCSLRY